jgi:CDP-diacylglycerol pyrophosphatase
MYGRTQNQLHIHLSCVRSDVKERLIADPKIKTYPAKPVRLKLPPMGHTYKVVKVRGLSGADSPFAIVHQLIGTKGQMGSQSIAVIGTDQSDVYYVVFTTYDRSTKNLAHAAELLDQTCETTPS